MILPPIRQTDPHGSGAYLAERIGHQHRGIDYACYAGSVLLSDVSGQVTRLGYPYSKTGKKAYLRLIELSVDSQTRVKYMYVYPSVAVGQHIKKGEQLGIIQDLTIIYPGITNHYHVEVWIEGEHVNPQTWLDNRG